ncbi:hypothetical protein DFH07DRAFT_969200 [Mycena maculata]|uniref:Uncharacterized protein n=1 Tax=Mycena maculata TaxID=230809 RepID=A0AAD7MTT6_9AGAR|nr:hypothetical protein DFH07DRAFT_969200 [Mycena maculata]
MANVSFDSAFMKQIMPSTLLPLSYAKEFYAVHDETSRPIIFSIGSTGTLFIFRPGQGVNGSNSLLNLSKLFGLPGTAVVSHLSVLQGTDNKIYISFAVQGAKTGGASSIYVVRPKMPTEWLKVTADTFKLAEWLIPDKSTLECAVKRLYTAGAAKPYPTVIVVYSHTDGIHNDAACLNVSDIQWDFADSFAMPENIDPDGMIDLCAGALPANIKGIFCLYELQGQKHLTFAGFRSGTYKQPYSTSLRPPPGARTLATFVNQEGYTDLLIGGTAISHYTAQATAHSDTPTTPNRYTVVVDDHASLGDPRQMFVAQANAILTIYYRNANDTVLYQRFQDVRPGAGTAKLVTQGPLIPLLGREDGGGHLTVLLDDATGSQRLFSVATDDSLTLMEQSGDTHLWQRIPVLVPSIAGENTDIVSFTSHISLKDATGVGLPKATILLCSSSAADVGYNGGVLSVTSAGRPVTTDISGDITLIHSVSTLSTVTFTLKDVEGKSVLGGKTYIVNPAKNAQHTLLSIKSADNLRAVQLRSGRKLVDTSKVSSGNLDAAAKAIAQLSVSLQQMPKDGSESDTAEAEVAETPSMFAFSDVGAGGGGVLDLSDWGIWHWLTIKWQQIEEWSVDAWHFVVKIAGKVYNFLLKGLSYVWKAIHFVLQDILHIPIDDIIEWLGFIFEWGDITETHNMIVAMANAAMDYTVDKVHDFRATVDDLFDKADKWIAQLDTIPPDMRKNQLSGKTANDQIAGNQDYSTVQSAPGANWSSYQLKHGGVGKSLAALDPGPEDPLVSFWNDLRDILSEIEKAMKDAFQDFLLIFQKDRQFTLEQLLAHFGINLLRHILKVIRKIADGIIDLVAAFITLAQKLMNTTINIPLLSPLYRGISGGNDLTALDAMALLIAIPTTVLFKLITGKKPSEGLDLGQFLQDYSALGVRARHSSRETSMMAVGFVESPGEVEVEDASGVLGISDETIEKIKLVATRLVSIAGPVISLILLVVAVDDWYIPDNGVPLEKLTGGFHWGWKVAGDVIVSAFTFPYAAMPNHSDLRLCRELSWGLNCITIFARASNVRVRGIVALAAGCFKLVPEGVSIPMAIAAANEIKTSDLPSKLEWVDVTDRITSCAFIAAGGVCMLINEPEPISATVASVLALTAISCQTVKAWEAGAHFADFPTLSQGSFVGGT